MSINALTNAAAARRPDFFPLNKTPKGLREIAKAAATSPTLGGATPQESSSQVDTALHVLFGYIPTEVLTLYVAVLAAVQQPNKVTSADWIAFWSFLVATPVVVWLVYGAKVKAANKPLPLNFGTWPLWEMVNIPWFVGAVLSKPSQGNINGRPAPAAEEVKSRKGKARSVVKTFQT